MNSRPPPPNKFLPAPCEPPRSCDHTLTGSSHILAPNQISVVAVMQLIPTLNPSSFPRAAPEPVLGDHSVSDKKVFDGLLVLLLLYVIQKSRKPVEQALMCFFTGPIGDKVSVTLCIYRSKVNSGDSAPSEVKLLIFHRSLRRAGWI